MDWREALGKLRTIRAVLEVLGDEVGALQARDPDLNLDALGGSFLSLRQSVDNAVKRIGRYFDAPPEGGK